MLPAPSIYPRFAANQLLTESSLNQMVEYFDGQVRDTRIYLNGLGIYYGLDLDVEINNDGTAKLIVQKGIGVSSDGFLFKLEDRCVFDKYVDNQTVQKEKLQKEGCIYDDSIIFKDDYPVQELIPDTVAKTGSEALTTAILQNKVVVFLCEFKESNVTGVERCFNELDEKGISKTTILRMLLFDKNDVNQFSNLEGGTNSGGGGLAPIYIQRFGYTQEGTQEAKIDLPSILSVADFKKKYTDIFEKAFTGGGTKLMEDIADAYRNAAVIFFNLFGDDKDVFNSLGNRLETLYNDLSEGQIGFRQSLFYTQYFYDYLKDLILAYEEFACLEDVQRTGLFPKRCKFPKYLLLGIPPLVTVDANGNTTTPNPNDCQTSLQRPPVNDAGAAGIDETRLLFERMKKLANESILLPFNESFLPTKITPSRGRNLPLSERAIPFYLNASNLRPCWNPRLERLGKINEIPSYYPSGAAAPNDVPLFYEMDRYEFFRVEGHIGKGLKTAMAEISDVRERLNVPFAIQCVKLAANPNDVDVNNKLKGDFGDLERLYTKVKMDIICFIDHEYPDSQSNMKTLLNLLPDELSSFDYPLFEAQHQAVFADNPNTEKDDCNLPVLEKLSAEYTRRKDDITSLIWFHNFAKKHPGMEHMGGVYKGGTLVLVYTESEGQTVMADFCLPYNCCSDTPTIVYQINEVRPRLILEDEFCGNDTTEHDIIATPAGSMVTGPGVSGADGAFVFVPSVAAQGISFGNNDTAEVTIQSDFEGLTVTKVVTLQKPPAIEINLEKEYIIKENADGKCSFIGVVYTFSDGNDEAETGTYKWMFTNANGTVELSTDDSFSTEFPTGETGIIQVIAQRGICEGSASVEITACPEPVTVEFGEVVDNNGEKVDTSLPIDNTIIKELPLILDPVGGLLSLCSLKADGTTEDLDIILDETGESCEERKFRLNISQLPGRDLIAKPPISGKYQLKYEFAGCGVLSTLNFAIKKVSDSETEDENRESDTDDVNPQMPRSRAARRPQSKSTSKPATKSSAKSSTKPTSKTKESPAKKTASKAVSKKAKPTPKKKTTTASTAKKKASPPKKETPKPKVEKLQNGARVMNLRRTAQQAVLKKLEDENKLKGKSFGLGMSAFLFPGNDLERLNQRFEEAMKALLASVKRSKAELKPSWIQFVETLLHNYLDKRVALIPTSLDEATIGLLKTQIGKMKELKLNVKTMQKNWKGAELEKALKASIIKKINSLF